MDSLFVLFLAFFIWLGSKFFQAIHWQKIRSLATIYANHFSPTLAANGYIHFGLKPDSPWSEQSHAYNEMEIEIGTLVSGFAFGASFFMAGLAWKVSPPNSLGIAVLASGGLFLFLLPLGYAWGFRWIPRAVARSLHYPPDKFFDPSILQKIPLWQFVIEWLFLCLWGLVFYYYGKLDLPMAGIASFFLLAARIVLPMAKRIYPTWRSEDEFFESYDFENMRADWQAGIQEIRSHPNYEALFATLPEHTRQVAGKILDEGVSLDLLSLADLAPEEEWQDNPLLKILFNGNPEFLPLIMDEFLFDLKTMLRDFKEPQPAAVDQGR